MKCDGCGYDIQKIYYYFAPEQHGIVLDDMCVCEYCADRILGDLVDELYDQDYDGNPYKLAAEIKAESVHEVYEDGYWDVD